MRKRKWKLTCVGIAGGMINLGGMADPTTSWAAENETEAETQTAEPVAKITDETREVVVTANRYQTRELDAPAAMEILTSEDLEATGGRNIADALRYSQGITYSTYGPGSSSMSSMTSKAVIRGVDSGTLVLINGIPLNLRGLYNLEDIPIDSVERVEIVRGGGSVLYGSEATGGVINILTKNKYNNQIRVEVGNKGQQGYQVSAQAGKIGINYVYDKFGSIGTIGISTRAEIVAADPTGRYNYMNFDGYERNNLSLTYQMDDKWSLLYSYNKDRSNYAYHFLSGISGGKSLKDELRYTREYETIKNLAQLTYQSDGLKGTLFYNDSRLSTQGVDYRSSTGSLTGYPKWTDSSEKNRAYGLDAQYEWLVGKDKLLIGGTGQNEYFRERGSSSYERDNYSVYGSWEHPFGSSTTMILSGRESWTKNAPDDKNYRRFTPQIQLIHQLSDHDNIYASAGESFKMPTFKQIYGSTDGRVRGNPFVKPQEGQHYEIGWKRNKDNQTWRVAVFHYLIKDNITSSAITPGSFDYKYSNEDLRNSGVELSWGWKDQGPWAYDFGVTFGNPESKTTAKPYWDRAFGKFQLDGTIRYQKKRWEAGINFSYLADRVMTPSSRDAEYVKPYLLTSVSLKYKPAKNKEIYLAIENIFDRKDIISHTSSEYYSTPLNFRVGYRMTF